MEKFNDLVARLIKLQQDHDWIVGQLSKTKLKLFYEFLEKAERLHSLINHKDEIKLSGFAEGETLVNENDSVPYYRGPYTFVAYENGVFQITRKDAVNKAEGDCYLEGNFSITISSTNLKVILRFISQLSKYANFSTSFLENPTGNVFSVVIQNKDLREISKAEMPAAEQMFMEEFIK